MTFDQFKGLTIFSDDFRSMGYCSKGVRTGFANHGLSYAEFISNGIDASDLLSACNGNELVLKNVEAANERRRK